MRTPGVYKDRDSFASSLARRLMALYPLEFSEEWINEILRLASGTEILHSPLNETDVMVICYPHSVETPGISSLASLFEFLSTKLKGHIGNVHLLPFFPFTSDDGFAISDYTSVDQAFGDWEDIERIAGHFGLMVDLVINHVSAAHGWFRGYLNGDLEYNRFFIEKDETVDYSAVVRPRSTPLFTHFDARQAPVEVWTTFSADQVDLNFGNPNVLFELIKIFISYLRRGVRFIRLDAIAFLWKEPGASSIHLWQTHQIVKLLRDIASEVAPGVQIITETNVPSEQNWSYFGQGDEANLVYQFGLPPLLLHALFFADSTCLHKWAEQIPDPPSGCTYLNFTASHDGIGVRPLEGIVPADDLNLLLEGMKGFGALISEKANADGSKGVYEINIAYPDALAGTSEGRDGFRSGRFICSQAVMLAMKGIPAFYLNSLLGLGNDYAGVEKTGMNRSINRRRLTRDEAGTLLNKNSDSAQIFHALLHLVGVRRNRQEFHPDAPQRILWLGSSFLAIVRGGGSGNGEVYCLFNLTPRKQELTASFVQDGESWTDLLNRDLPVPQQTPLLFRPYQVRWICRVS